MRIIDCAQNSPEWFLARCGVPSSSRYSEIVTSKGEPSKSAIKYMRQLAVEAITKTKEGSFQSFAMKRGSEMEEEAAEFYALFTNREIEKIGFCLHDTINAGSSPDRLVGKDGLLEVKCPNYATYVDYRLADKLPTTYLPQVQGQLFVTGREWCDFMVYVPGIAPFIKRVYPSTDFHKALEIELTVFTAELKQLIERLK